MMHFKIVFMSYNKMKAHMSFQPSSEGGYKALLFFEIFTKKRDNFLILPNSSEKIRPNCKNKRKYMNCLKYPKGQI